MDNMIEAHRILCEAKQELDAIEARLRSRGPVARDSKEALGAEVARAQALLDLVARAQALLDLAQMQAAKATAIQPERRGMFVPAPPETVLPSAPTGSASAGAERARLRQGRR